jgi:hypothetical protein
MEMAGTCLNKAHKPGSHVVSTLRKVSKSFTDLQFQGTHIWILVTLKPGRISSSSNWQNRSLHVALQDCQLQLLLIWASLGDFDREKTSFSRHHQALNSEWAAASVADWLRSWTPRGRHEPCLHPPCRAMASLKWSTRPLPLYFRPPLLPCAHTEGRKNEPPLLPRALMSSRVLATASPPANRARWNS